MVSPFGKQFPDITETWSERGEIALQLLLITRKKLDLFWSIRVILSPQSTRVILKTAGRKAPVAISHQLLPIPSTTSTIKFYN